MINKNKTNWHLILFSTPWAYWTSIKIAMGFMSFHLIYIIEVVLHIECKIFRLHLAIKPLPNTADIQQQLHYYIWAD